MGPSRNPYPIAVDFSDHIAEMIRDVQIANGIDCYSNRIRATSLGRGTAITREPPGSCELVNYVGIVIPSYQRDLLAPGCSQCC